MCIWSFFTIISAENEDTSEREKRRGKRHLPEEFKRTSIVKLSIIIERKSESFVRSRSPKLAEKEIALKIIAPA